MPRVHHLSCGTMCPLGGRAISGRDVFVCHVLAVETRAGLVIVDSGYGLGDVRDPGRLGAGVALTKPALREEETVLRRLEALGFSARDVRHVVLTHLDVDHAGGISDFPDATVHVMQKEHDAAMARRTLAERARYRPAHFAHGPRWKIHDAGGERWNGFEAVRAIDDADDEILLVPLEGHTRGHAGVAVRDASGWMLHAGDAYFHHHEVYAGGSAPLGIRLFSRVNAIDDRRRRENVERLRDLARRGEVRVFSAHDPEELRELGGVP